MTAQIGVGNQLGHGTGHISAAGFTGEQANELAETISSGYMVDVAPDAPGCCIDGRACLHTMAGPEAKSKPGPSVAGGPSVTAYAAAEMVPGYFGENSGATTFDRIDEVNNMLVSGKIVLGCHVTDGAVKNDFLKRDAATGELTDQPQTGCGASDSFKSILAKPTSKKDFVEATTAQLLDEGVFKSEFMQFTDADTLAERVKDYNSKTMLEVLAEQSQGQGVEVLTGTHAEVLVVFNYSEGKTVDRDRLVAETGKQVFVVDMWYIDRLAYAMAAGRPDAEDMYQKLRHAMTAFQVSTYAELCDGTHRPVILRQQGAAVAAVR